MRYINCNLAPQEWKFAFRPRGQPFVWSAPHAQRYRAHVLHLGSLLQVATFGDSWVCRSSLRCALGRLEMFMGMRFPDEFLAPYVSYTTAAKNITLRLAAYWRLLSSGKCLRLVWWVKTDVPIVEWKRWQLVPPKRLYLYSRLHGCTPHKKALRNPVAALFSVNKSQIPILSLFVLSAWRLDSSFRHVLYLITFVFFLLSGFWLVP